MKRILVVGEDALCCALGEKLVAAALPGWSLAGPAIDTKGVTKLIPALPRYSEQAQFVQPVLCIADTVGLLCYLHTAQESHALVPCAVCLCTKIISLLFQNLKG